MTSPQELMSQESQFISQTPQLESLIERALSRGIAQHGDLVVDLEVFAAHIKSIIHKRLGASPETGATIRFVAALHAEDLYLAAGCNVNSVQAWNRLAALHNTHISNVAHSVCSTHQEARDLASEILAHLFFHDRNGHRRIASYDGLCALKTWLATIVRHQAINHRELKSAEGVSLDSLRRTPSATAARELETVLLSARYGDVLRDSFKAAAEQLTQRERLVLILRFEDEIPPGRIAQMMGVHPAQITRALKRAELKLSATALTRLRICHRITPEALKECVAAVFQNPERVVVAVLEAIRPSADANTIASVAA